MAAGVAQIPWYATLFRGDQFAAALEEIAPVATRYGATEYKVYRNRDEIAALLLCSRVKEDVGHVTQICVSRRYRQRGLGAWLLAECSRALRGRGFRALTLTVTRQNSQAVALYRRSGFTTRQTFDAMVWERRGRGRT